MQVWNITAHQFTYFVCCIYWPSKLEYLLKMTKGITKSNICVRYGRAELILWTIRREEFQRTGITIVRPLAFRIFPLAIFMAIYSITGLFGWSRHVGDIGYYAVAGEP